MIPAFAGIIGFIILRKNYQAVYMKNVVSFLITISLMAATLIGLHYLILFFGLNDVTALILFALPVTVLIAHSTHETAHGMWKSAISIYVSFVSVVLISSGLVWFID